MKGQMTLINAVMIMLSLIVIAFVAGLFFPVLNNILLPSLNNGVDGGMGFNLSLLIFPLILIGLIVIIWLWARPFIG